MTKQLALILIAVAVASPQDLAAREASAEELAKAAQNPVAPE